MSRRDHSIVSSANEKKNGRKEEGESDREIGKQ